MRYTRIHYERFGEPREVLQVADADLEPPGPGEVLVRMSACPINPSDILPIRGAYSHRTALPAVPGFEGVGTVVDTGPGVSGQLIGRRVLPLRGQGTWQQYVKSPAQWLVPVPSSIGDEAAAQLYINPVTAWLVCAEALKLREGDVFLVNACGSSLGRIFAQLAGILHYRLIAVTGDADNAQELLRLGASHVLHSDDIPTMRNYVMELTKGEGAAAAVDSIGGPPGNGLASCLKRQGILLSLGLLSGISLDWGALKQSFDIRLQLFHLRHWNQDVTEPQWHAAFNRILSWVAEGRLAVRAPAARCRLTEIREAVEAAESPDRRSGKVILTF
ncbi:zinc-dependent alcohol dehydrogenase family protein [Cohnella boryungensis]|uniref:zinc-dependent alcohol dehydrogenase family protein n=1 Tax=Cohnella boryungensis TaxID=768479 RepID=UPI003672E05B